MSQNFKKYSTFLKFREVIKKKYVNKSAAKMLRNSVTHKLKITVLAYSHKYCCHLPTSEKWYTWYGRRLKCFRGNGETQKFPYKWPRKAFHIKNVLTRKNLIENLKFEILTCDGSQHCNENCIRSHTGAANSASVTKTLQNKTKRCYSQICCLLGMNIFVF